MGVEGQRGVGDVGGVGSGVSKGIKITVAQKYVACA